jgi:hypothetical protein
MSRDRQVCLFDAFNGINKDSISSQSEEGRAQLVYAFNAYWILETGPRARMGASGSHFLDHTIDASLNDLKNVFLNPHISPPVNEIYEAKTRYEWQFLLLPFSVDGHDNDDDLILSNFSQVYKKDSIISWGPNDFNIVTLYDWKQYGGFEEDETITWHLGSKGSDHRSICSTFRDLYYAHNTPRCRTIANMPFKLAELESHPDHGRTNFKLL